MADPATTEVVRPGSPRARTTSRRSSSATRRRRTKALVYLAPALLIYTGFVIYPALNTIQLSFLDWDGVQVPTVVGLDNYAQIFQNPELYRSVLNALVLIVFFTVIPVVVGLVMTALLMGRVRRGMTFFRTVFFLPQVLPLVAVGITWRWLYNETGMLNQFLEAVGLGGITRAWLGDFDLALYALGFIGTWVMSGLCMMLFLSGVQKIDGALYEAASLGRASCRERVSTSEITVS